MSTQMQLRGGTTAENLLFTGAQREVTVDTDKNVLIVHDGLTAGGFPVASEQSVSDSTIYFNDDVGAGSAANAYILSPKPNTTVPTAYLDGIALGFVTTNANTGPSSATFAGLGVRPLKYAGGSDPAAGEIFGRVNLVYDAAAGWFEIQRAARSANPQLRTLTASVSGNALTATLAPSVIDFRAPSLPSGTVNTRTLTSPLVGTIPAGATLGTVNAVSSRIVVLAIDNVGTVEMAFINLAGSPNLDETTLINTVALSGASTSANTFYSAVARTGVPYRVLGFVESTQATAGTWSSSPTEVQGQGGQANVGLRSITTTAAQNTTSGTSIDFTSIPAGVKRITLNIDRVSVSADTSIIVQIGAGSVEVTGYTSVVSRANTFTTTTVGATISQMVANESYFGHVTLSNVSGNVWVFSGVLGGIVIPLMMISAATKTIGGVLDRVRLTTISGVATFDLGSVSLTYEG